MSMDSVEVATILQTWLSEGHTLPESLASLVMCAREGRLTPNNMLVTLEAVRNGFKLWHTRRAERAALLNVLSSWSAAQQHTKEAGSAVRGATPGKGSAQPGSAPKGSGGTGSRSGRRAAVGAAGGAQRGAALGTCASGGSTGCGDTEVSGAGKFASASACTQECMGAETRQPAGGTPTKTSRGRRRFAQKPHDPADVGVKRLRGD